MKLRISIRHALLGISTLCVACAAWGCIQRSTETRLRRDWMLAHELMGSVDSFHFTIGDPSLVEQLCGRVNRSFDIPPIESCEVCFVGLKNHFDLRELDRFSNLKHLELYNCELTDDQWRCVSENHTIRSVELSAGTELSEQGRQMLESAKMTIIDWGL
jgi:hypothetical protein